MACGLHHGIVERDVFKDMMSWTSTSRVYVKPPVIVPLTLKQHFLGANEAAAATEKEVGVPSLERARGVSLARRRAASCVST